MPFVCLPACLAAFLLECMGTYAFILFYLDVIMMIDAIFIHRKIHKLITGLEEKTTREITEIVIVI